MWLYTSVGRSPFGSNEGIYCSCYCWVRKDFCPPKKESRWIHALITANWWIRNQQAAFVWHKVVNEVRAPSHWVQNLHASDSRDASSMLIFSLWTYWRRMHLCRGSRSNAVTLGACKNVHLGNAVLSHFLSNNSQMWKGLNHQQQKGKVITSEFKKFFEDGRLLEGSHSSFVSSWMWQMSSVTPLGCPFVF